VLNAVWLLFMMLVSRTITAPNDVITGKDLAVSGRSLSGYYSGIYKKAVTACPGIIRVFAWWETLKKIVRAESDKARIRTWHFPEFKPGSYLGTELFIPMKLFVLEKLRRIVLWFKNDNSDFASCFYGSKI